MKTGARSRLVLGGALLMAGLAGVACRSVPDRDPGAGVAVPEFYDQGGNGDAVSMDPWWRGFEDSNLHALVESAWTNNFDLAAAVARLSGVTAQARIAGADLYPSVGAGFDVSRSQRNFIGFPFSSMGFGTNAGSAPEVLSARTTAYALNMNLSWELDLWGRLRSGRRAALAEVAASRADLEALYQSLAGQTVKAWVALAEAGQLTSLARTTVESYEATASEVRCRYNKGLRPPLDLRLAMANLAAARALLESRELAEVRAGQALQVLLGRYPAELAGTDVPFPEIPAHVPAGLPSELLSRRPDLVAARKRLLAADWRVEESEAALFPRLSLTASGGTSTEELADLLDPDFKVWNLAANLAQPIFQGGRLRAGVDLSRAQTRRALAEYQAIVLRAFAEVESALAAESRLARREAQIREASVQSAAALALAQARYQNGLDTFITVLEAQRRSLEAETEWVAVRRARLENRVDLHLALGGGFGAGTRHEAGTASAGDDSGIETES